VCVHAPYRGNEFVVVVFAVTTKFTALVMVLALVQCLKFVMLPTEAYNSCKFFVKCKAVVEL
jgi:hypothetical protein